MLKYLHSNDVIISNRIFTEDELTTSRQFVSFEEIMSNSDEVNKFKVISGNKCIRILHSGTILIYFKSLPYELTQDDVILIQVSLIK